MLRGIGSILLLICSNTFMTLAWYGQIMFKSKLERFGLYAIVFLSWGIAFFEYCLQVPANRIGFVDNGGPFTLMQLKVVQEVISLMVFTIIANFMFQHQEIDWNHFAAFGCLVLAVYFVFMK